MERESIRQDNQNQDLTDLNIEIANLREKENVLNAKWQNERRRFEELQQLQELSANLSDKYESAERLGQYDEALRFRNQKSETDNEINQLLSVLEKSHTSEDVEKAAAKKADDAMQLSFIQLDDPLLLQIKEDILNTNIDTLTPVEALMKLNEIKKLLNR